MSISLEKTSEHSSKVKNSAQYCFLAMSVGNLVNKTQHTCCFLLIRTKSLNENHQLGVTSNISCIIYGKWKASLQTRIWLNLGQILSVFSDFLNEHLLTELTKCSWKDSVLTQSCQSTDIVSILLFFYNAAETNWSADIAWKFSPDGGIGLVIFISFFKFDFTAPFFFFQKLQAAYLQNLSSSSR